MIKIALITGLIGGVSVGFLTAFVFISIADRRSKKNEIKY